MEGLLLEEKPSEKSSQKVLNTITTRNKKSVSITHLYMQEKLLKKMPKLDDYKQLTVLYLYNNQIKEIENLHDLPNLTSLYFQNNKIEKIENLSNLKNLKKLYLGRNKISVIENLEPLESLQELHIERQDLTNDIPLCFDPRTIISISITLQVLNISHNKLTSLFHLTPLRKLLEINASHNDLDDIKDVCHTIQNWFYLKNAKFIGNPVTKKHRYKEDIIANTHSLEILDDKNIPAATRDFIKRFEEGKLIHGSKHSINLADHIRGLPKNYPTAIQKAVSASMLKDSKCKLMEDMSTFDEANAVHIAWQQLPKRRPFVKVPNQYLQNNRKLEVQRKKIVINKFPTNPF